MKDKLLEGGVLLNGATRHLLTLIQPQLWMIQGWRIRVSMFKPLPSLCILCADNSLSSGMVISRPLYSLQQMNYIWPDSGTASVLSRLS